MGRCNGLDCGVKIKVTSVVSYLCVYFVCVQSDGADNAKQKNNKKYKLIPFSITAAAVIVFALIISVMMILTIGILCALINDIVRAFAMIIIVILYLYCHVYTS